MHPCDRPLQCLAAPRLINRFEQAVDGPDAEGVHGKSRMRPEHHDHWALLSRQSRQLRGTTALGKVTVPKNNIGPPTLNRRHRLRSVSHLQACDLNPRLQFQKTLQPHASRETFIYDKQTQVGHWVERGATEEKSSG